MDSRHLKAIEDLLRRRTGENTANRQVARDWILRDGIHRKDGWLKRDPNAAEAAPASQPKTKKAK